MSSAKKRERGFHFETVQSIPFRTMCEALKEVLVDCLVNFTPDGVSLACMDNTKCIIVEVQLFAKCIERYSCDDSYEICLNLSTFHKVVKTITTSDSVHLSYEERNPYVLQISIESIEKRSSNNFSMKLLKNVREVDINFDVSEFDTVMQMQCTTFQKICKDLLQTGGTHVEISTKDDSVCFKTVNSLLQSDFCLYETQQGFKFKKRSGHGTSSYGVFKLKSLLTFTKCTPLCPVVTLYLMENLPLVLQYNVASLGLIRFCVASLTDAEK